MNNTKGKAEAPAGHRGTAITTINEQLTTASSENTASPYPVASATRYRRSGRAKNDTVMARCPHAPHAHRHIWFGDDATSALRHPQCRPKTTYLVTITRTVPDMAVIPAPRSAAA